MRSSCLSDDEVRAIYFELSFPSYAMHAVRCACCCTAFACVVHATACTHLPHCLARVPCSLMGHDPRRQDQHSVHLLERLHPSRVCRRCLRSAASARSSSSRPRMRSISRVNSHRPLAPAPLLPPRVLSCGTILSDASPSSSPCDRASSSICTVHGPASLLRSLLLLLDTSGLGSRHMRVRCLQDAHACSRAL